MQLRFRHMTDAESSGAHVGWRAQFTAYVTANSAGESKMSKSSSSLAVDEASPEGTASAKKGSTPAGPSAAEPKRESVGLPATPATPAPVTSESSRGSMGLPIAIVVLLCGTLGFGLFGMVQFQSANSLRTELSALTTTVADLQTRNDHYEGILTRVRVATGSLQASLAELNQLATLPAPIAAASIAAAPAAVVESTPASESESAE
ncbi:MAG: hypothetical protein JRG90_16535 [Deltaproteobacteria bacterium]|nr:hypothetical protein [Deltaproteobacteria bacterium]